MRSAAAVVLLLSFAHQPAEAGPNKARSVQARPAAALVHARPLAVPASRPRQAATRAAVAASQARMVGTVQHAAARTGADPALLVAMAWRESRLDPQARSAQSSARGLMQFTESTWLETVRDHGARHGLAREAAALTIDRRTGVIGMSDGHALQRLLALRYDPDLAAALAGARLVAAREKLEQAIGREAGVVDLYAVHLLGVSGGRRFLARLNLDPGASAAEAVGREAAERNRGVFFAPGGRALSMREVHAAMVESTAAGRRLLASAGSVGRFAVADASVGGH